MKIVIATDGSECTKKALAFLVTHENLAGAEDELLVLNMQPSLPPRVAPLVGSNVVKDYHRDEANKVLDPHQTISRSSPDPLPVQMGGGCTRRGDRGDHPAREGTPDRDGHARAWAARSVLPGQRSAAAGHRLRRADVTGQVRWRRCAAPACGPWRAGAALAGSGLRQALSSQPSRTS